MWPLPELTDEEQRECLTDPEYQEARDAMIRLSPAWRATLVTVLYFVAVAEYGYGLLRSAALWLRSHLFGR